MESASSAFPHRRAFWAVTGSAGGPQGGLVDSGQGLHRVSRGRVKKLANPFEFQSANNPVGLAIDSNPFDVQALHGHGALVADAAANTLLRFTRKTGLEVIAVSPQEVVSTANIQ
jgi:hypothetical protein